MRAPGWLSRSASTAFSVLQAEALALGLQDVATVCEPIQRRSGKPLAAEHLGPVLGLPITLLFSNTAIQQISSILRSGSQHCWNWSSGAINAWTSLMEENNVRRQRAVNR
jgi:hypothetical protein